MANNPPTTRIARGHRAFTTLLVTAIVGVIIALVVSAVRSPRSHSGENDLGNPPGMVDRLDVFDSAGDWESGASEHVAVLAGPARVTPVEATARWTSPEVSTPLAFTELIPSWNVTAPPGTGLRMDVRVRSRDGRWSPWLYLGSFGRNSSREKRVTACRQGAVNVDYLSLKSPADAYQVRVEFSRPGGDRAAAPALRRLAVSYSGVVTDDTRRAALAEPTSPAPSAGWARDLAVPFRCQKDVPGSMAGEICSPTSVSMVMAYCGVDRPTADNAHAIYDPDNDLFGNWGRAVARAGELGLDAWVTRFRNWDAVKTEIARGQLIVASIRFRPGEFPSAVLPETTGHLIVIRGFTPAGDVIVNDPASRERGNGAVYRAEELARAWFDHGGVGYVIRRAANSGIPTASLR
jgi:hypothetical protein